MSKRGDRLAAQVALDAEHAQQQQQRVDYPLATPPPADSPEFCGPNLRGNHRHDFWRSKTDGKRRCFYCLDVRD